MSWVQLTSTHVLARLTTDEKEAFEAVGEDTSTDKLSGIIEQVTSLVRSKVASCSSNTMGPAGTIPSGSLWHAVSLCRAGLVAAQPTMEGQTDPRAAETREAYRYLDQLARCEVLADVPEVPPVPVSGSWGSKPLMDF
ncbi:hypothetical protein OKA04_23455 [Luteolibacter flavescens]|uniref:DUF1320 domain-containing protein n=1 Tax=Luteolibacter flavescens TaxID=1859460 RepID=A0ABT3FWL2_9BACT|nr:hypothetical protein [Luteolibacter flavescens]MCW1887714.1 hypothetical protein [Luteolibacter flavescens]